MRKTSQILILFCCIAVTAFLSCKELPRDNPLDLYNNSNQVKGVSLKFSKYVVVHDNNEDSTANPNETVYVRVYLRNNGTSDASGVEGTISNGSSYVQDLNPTSSVSYSSGYGYGYIDAGSEQYGYYSYAPNFEGYTFRFKVAPETPAGSDISFSIHITTYEGGVWDDQFTIPVAEINAKLNYSKHLVVYDNNQDGIINQNETVYLQVFLKNNGISKANDVKATFTSASGFISGIYPTSQVTFNSGSGSGDITPGGEEYGYYSHAPDYDIYTFRFKVNEGTPAGTNITFAIHITDDESNAWEDDFTVQVAATGAQLNYSKYLIVYDDNDDGIINKGETAYLQVFIKNNGSSAANGVKATITSSSAYISNIYPTSQVTYNSGSGSSDILPGGEEYGQYSYAPDYSAYTVRFKVAGTTPNGSTIILVMHITDEEGNNWEDDFSVTVQSL